MLWEEPNSQITQGADKQWGHLPIASYLHLKWSGIELSMDYLIHRITEMIVIMPSLIQRVATILNANLTRRAIYDFFAEKQPNA